MVLAKGKRSEREGAPLRKATASLKHNLGRVQPRSVHGGPCETEAVDGTETSYMTMFLVGVSWLILAAPVVGLMWAVAPLPLGGAASF